MVGMVKVGNIVFDPKEIAGIRYFVMSPEENGGIELENYFTLIFKAYYGHDEQKLEYSGYYSEVQPMVHAILTSLGEVI
jgi:hypothetical protein